MLDRTIAPPVGALKYSSFPQAKRLEGSRFPLYYINAGEQPVVKLQLKFASGIWYESALGESWFTAKMLLEGTSTRTALQISEAFQSLGAFTEIDPGFDDVTFSVYGLHRNFDEVLDLINHVLFDSIFPEKELETLKQIRLDELRVNNSKTNMVSSKKIREALFGLDHPYGRALTEDDIKAINRDQVVSYHRQKLFNGVEVFLSGLIDDRILSWVDDKLKFETININDSSPVRLEAKSTQSIFVERPDNLQSSIKLGWMIPNKAHPDSFDLSIANTLLGGYFGSRLMKNIREDKGYTYGISSYPVHLKHSSFLIIGTDVKAEFTSLTISEVKKEIDAIIHQNTPSEEIEMVVNYLSGTFYSSLNTPFKLMAKFQTIHNIDMGYDYYQRYFSALSLFNQEKLSSIMSKYLDPEKMHEIVVGSK